MLFGNILGLIILCALFVIPAYAAIRYELGERAKRQAFIKQVAAQRNIKRSK